MLKECPVHMAERRQARREQASLGEQVHGKNPGFGAGRRPSAGEQACAVLANGATRYGAIGRKCAQCIRAKARAAQSKRYVLAYAGVAPYVAAML